VGQHSQGTEMQAAQYKANGDDAAGIELVTVPMPEPKNGEVLVKVEFASINPIDWRVMGGNLKDAGWSMPLPFTPGYDLAGTVVGEAGKFKDGERVFTCNWGQHKHDDEGEPVGGAWAQYAVVPSKKLSPVPKGLSLSQAAALPLVGLTALQTVRDCAKVKKGSKVLVLGASGAVGMLAVQLAKHEGATFVATTCSTRNIDFVSTLGADKIIDYSKDDWAKDPELKGLDAVLDYVGEKDVFPRAKTLLKDGGKFVSIADFDAGFDPAAHPPLSYAAFYCLRSDAKMQSELASLVVDGKLKLRMDEEFSFTTEGVRAMMKKSQGGKAVGKNVLSLATPGTADMQVTTKKPALGDAINAAVAAATAVEADLKRDVV